MTYSVYSGRNRHHPYVSGEANRLVQPVSFASPPGTPVYTEVVASCSHAATPTAVNKLRIDSGAWTGSCGFCGYQYNIPTPAIGGLFECTAIETDINPDDTMVFKGSPFPAASIGVSATYVLEPMVQAFVFPGDVSET